MTEQTLIERLHIRASIRRNIPSRKSVQEGKPDRMADLLDEAGFELAKALTIIRTLRHTPQSAVYQEEADDFLEQHTKKENNDG